MSKRREFLLSKNQALQKTEDELAKILIDYFAVINHRSPSKEEEENLKVAVKWVKGKGSHSLSWSKLEKNIADGTWDPRETPGAMFSPG